MITAPARQLLAATTFAIAATPAFAQDAPRLVPLALFGCDDCEGPLLFSDVRAVEWIGRDRLLVVDGSAPFVRILSADGDVIAAFAGEGSGPGELRTPMTAAAMTDDVIEVLDIRLLRRARYATDGRFIDARTFPREAFPLGAARIPGRDAWLVVATDFAAPTPAVHRLDDGADTSVLVLAPRPDFPRNREGEPSAIMAFAVAPDGSFAIGEGAFAYRILRFAADGSPRDAIVRDIPRPRRTAAEMRQLQDRRARMADRVRAMRAAEGGGPGPLPPVSGERNHFDAGALVYDRRGRLWVRTTRGGEERTIFDVFGPAGELLAEVSVDGRVGVFAFGHGLLVGAIAHADGVPRLATWRVEG